MINDNSNYKERDSNRIQKKQVMDNKTAHHLLTENQPIFKVHWFLLHSSPVYILDMKFYDMEYLFIQFGAALWPDSLTVFCAPAHWAWNTWLNASTTYQNICKTPKHLCIVSIILILNPKCNTIPDTKKKMEKTPYISSFIFCVRFHGMFSLKYGVNNAVKIS